MGPVDKFWADHSSKITPTSNDARDRRPAANESFDVVSELDEG
jgi:hypothetical protein